MAGGDGCNYGATADNGARGGDVESSSSSETKPLRQAFSMDYGDATGFVEQSPPPYCKHMAALSAYVLGCTLTFGFCLGFAASFWISGRFWRSPLGLEKLGCTDALRVGGAAAAAVRGPPLDVASEVGQDLLSVPPYDHITRGKAAAADSVNYDNGWGSIYGPPLIDIMKNLKERKHRHKHKHRDAEDDSQNNVTDPKNVEIVGTTRPNVYLNHVDAYEMLLDAASTGAGSVILNGVGGGGGKVPPALSKYSRDYFLLSAGWDAQINRAYCAVATVSTVLNSLRFLHPRSEVGVDIPTDAVYSPYNYATQVDVFGPCTQQNVISHTGGGRGVNGIRTYPFGLSLSQTAALLRCHLSPSAGWTVVSTPLDRDVISAGRMRDELKGALADPNARALVNYHRRVAGQAGDGGHFSPVASYSPPADAFLILDVAKYKYPPVWVPTERLYESLATYDGCGEWDYPGGQERLDAPELRNPTTEEEREEAGRALGCRRTLRGYVVARKV